MWQYVHRPLAKHLVIKVSRELAGFAAARGNLFLLEARRTPMRRPQPNPAVRANVTCRECEDSSTILRDRNKRSMWLDSIRIVYGEASKYTEIEPTACTGQQTAFMS